MMSCNGFAWSWTSWPEGLSCWEWDALNMILRCVGARAKRIQEVDFTASQLVEAGMRAEARFREGLDDNDNVMPNITDIDSTPDGSQFNGDGETDDLDDDNVIDEDGTDTAND